MMYSLTYWSRVRRHVVGAADNVIAYELKSMEFLIWPADGTSFELWTERRSMVFHRSNGQRCSIDAMLNGTSWSVSATAVVVTWAQQQAMEHMSQCCFCCVRPRPIFCVGAVDDGDMKLPLLTAFHCRCSRHFMLQPHLMARWHGRLCLIEAASHILSRSRCWW